jgi:hypothetical protein
MVKIFCLVIVNPLSKIGEIKLLAKR